MRVVVFYPEFGNAVEANVENTRDYYKLLEVECFDIARLNDDLNVFVDDSGLLVENNSLSRVYGRTLAGILVFTGGVDATGETLPLPDRYTTDFIEASVYVINSGS